MTWRADRELPTAVPYLLAVACAGSGPWPTPSAPGMRLLRVRPEPVACYAADAGVGLRPARQPRLARRPRGRAWSASTGTPGTPLVQHGIGMTDLVKRATPRADELHHRRVPGRRRPGRPPGATGCGPAPSCVVGLAGWRAAVDRRAVAGVQPEPFGGRPVYVMPSTSGLNASTSDLRRPDRTTSVPEAAAGSPTRRTVLAMATCAWSRLDEYLHDWARSPPSTSRCTSTCTTRPRTSGGFVRLGNRANEGHAEMTTCLYLPDGRVGLHVQASRDQRQRRASTPAA